MTLTDLRKTVDELSAAERRRFEDAGRHVFCRKGCGGCCHQPIGCLPEEVDILETYLTNPESYLPTLEMQVKGNTDLRCIFLDNRDSCIVYNDRPLTCRMYMVAADKPCDNDGRRKTIVRSKVANDIVKLEFDIKGKVILHKSLYLRLKDKV